MIIIGPGFACLATYHWSYQLGAAGASLSKMLAPLAFASHGVLVLFLAYTCDLKQTKSGAMVPLSFKNVLYLDVFGWIRDKEEVATAAEQLPLAEPLLPEEPVPAPIREPLTSAARRTISLETQASTERQVV